MLEPDKNPNSRLMVDPTGWLRHLMRRQFDSVTDLRYVNKRRAKAERKRQHSGDPHVAEYFHQLDDPYSHLTAQVLATFAERYDVVIKPHLIRASGGKNQPEAEKLAAWARRDAELVAPYYGLEFPEGAPVRPVSDSQTAAGRALSEKSDEKFIAALLSVLSCPHRVVYAWLARKIRTALRSVAAIFRLKLPDPRVLGGRSVQPAAVH